MNKITTTKTTSAPIHSYTHMEITNDFDNKNSSTVPKPEYKFNDDNAADRFTPDNKITNHIQSNIIENNPDNENTEKTINKPKWQKTE